MTAEELYHTLHRKPFRPLRVHVTDGRVFDIRDERMATVGETYFWIGFPAPGEKLPIYDDWVTLPLDWIARVEVLETTAAPAA